MERILFSLAAITAVLVSVVLVSSTDVRTATVEQMQGTDLANLAMLNTEDAEAAASSYYIYPTGSTSYEGDTISNTTNDTVTIPVNLLTDRNWAWAITASNISGTSAVIVIVQEASYLGTTSSAFDWDEIGRDTFAPGSSATVSDWIRGDHTTGFKQRIIIDGYTGTQSTRIRSKFIGKPN